MTVDKAVLYRIICRAKPTEVMMMISASRRMVDKTYDDGDGYYSECWYILYQALSEAFFDTMMNKTVSPVVEND
jgi:hypothetical protein